MRLFGSFVLNGRTQSKGPQFALRPCRKLGNDKKHIKFIFSACPKEEMELRMGNLFGMYVNKIISLFTTASCEN